MKEASEFSSVSVREREEEDIRTNCSNFSKKKGLIVVNSKLRNRNYEPKIKISF